MVFYSLTFGPHRPSIHPIYLNHKFSYTEDSTSQQSVHHISGVSSREKHRPASLQINFTFSRHILASLATSAMILPHFAPHQSTLPAIRDGSEALIMLCYISSSLLFSFCIIPTSHIFNTSTDLIQPRETI